MKFDPQHRKESQFRRQLTLIDLDTGNTPVIVRFYGAGSRAYCCLWIDHSATDTHARGSAVASGGGYHKDSDAMESAMIAAGVSFGKPFGGTGSRGEHDALTLLADHLGINRPLVLEAHP